MEEVIARVKRFAAMTVAGALSVACGSAGVGTTGTEGLSHGATCSPTGDVPCIAELAEPCEDIHSGYEGHEYCPAAPDPSQGYQIHVGPSDYSDPSNVAKYVAAPGV